jgi:tetratricopeptide (TPR) repeat protein
MASKVKKAQAKAREQMTADARKATQGSAALAADPLSPQNLKRMGLRLGLPVVAVWVVVALVRNLALTIVVGVITAALAAFLIWAIRTGKKRQNVAAILQKADTKEGRKEALEKLDTEFKKDDTAAIFAKAQLQMQEQPREALKTLEKINLSRVLATEADEARAQRAMIHLILGETDEARALVDPIDLKRHKDAKSRASLTAIIGEAWARSGQAKRAVELLEKIDPEDETYTDLKPQLLRSRAFAYAWASDTKQMKNVLRQMKALNVQYLMGFITKKKNPMGVAPRGVHPLLEKEAFDIVMKSGQVQRKMEFRRG